jgi:THAP domain
VSCLEFATCDRGPNYLFVSPSTEMSNYRCQREFFPNFFQWFVVLNHHPLLFLTVDGPIFSKDTGIFLVIMANICFINNCSSHRNNKNIIFYQFPEKTTVRQQWIDAISKVSKEGSKLCNLHFEASDFINLTGEQKIF